MSKLPLTAHLTPRRNDRDFAMDLNRVRLATLPSARTEYWISDVRPDGTAWRFDIYNRHKLSIAHFQYESDQDAEKARGQMFFILEHAVELVFCASGAESSDVDWTEETG
jgi:hypothetical protein